MFYDAASSRAEINQMKSASSDSDAAKEKTLPFLALQPTAFSVPEKTQGTVR